jgi:hypothetical protein
MNRSLPSVMLLHVRMVIGIGKGLSREVGAACLYHD